MATISEALTIAIQHHQAGRLQAAEQIYRQILAVNANQADAWHLLGVIAQQVGKSEIAVEYIGRAIRLKGDAEAFHLNLGAAYRTLHRVAEAVACYRRVIALTPNHPQAYYNLGNALEDQGMLDEAVACYRRAIELKPDLAESHNNLGTALKAQGKPDEAVACYRRALELKPDFAGVYNNLGAVLREQGKPDEAVACGRRALELMPDYADAHYNLGNALTDLGNLDKAAACYRRVIELKPNYAEAHNNLGHVLMHQGNLDEAIACCRRAIGLKPDFAVAHGSLASAFHSQGNFDEAVAGYRRAIELKPDYADAHWNQSLLSLLRGDFDRGWAEFEWRWKANVCRSRDFSQARWDGQPLEGKTILLHAEQGLGDTLQFVRYAHLVKERGAAVIVECPGLLLSLLQSCPGVDRLVGQGEKLPAFNVQAPLLSLPGIFHTTLGEIPATVPYLFADPGLVEHWRRELAGIIGFKIGIAWQGSPVHPNDRNRSIPLGCFEHLARCRGVRLLSLQKAPAWNSCKAWPSGFPSRNWAAA